MRVPGCERMVRSREIEPGFEFEPERGRIMTRSRLVAFEPPDEPTELRGVITVPPRPGEMRAPSRRLMLVRGEIPPLLRGAFEIVGRGVVRRGDTVPRPLRVRSEPDRRMTVPPPLRPSERMLATDRPPVPK